MPPHNTASAVRIKPTMSTAKHEKVASTAQNEVDTPEAAPDMPSATHRKLTVEKSKEPALQREPVLEKSEVASDMTQAAPEAFFRFPDLATELRFKICDFVSTQPLPLVEAYSADTLSSRSRPCAVPDLVSSHAATLLSCSRLQSCTKREVAFSTARTP